MKIFVYIIVMLIMLDSPAFADVSTVNSGEPESRLRSSFVDAEACSDFKVVENVHGQVVQKNLSQAAIIPEDVFQKEKDPKLSTVSLIVNENPTHKLFSLLQQLGKINDGQYARAGTVYVVTKKNPFQFLAVYRAKELSSVLLSLSKENTAFALKPVMQVPKKYDVSYSPTWIIEHEGKTHIYEGNYSISSLFTKNGTFRGAQDAK